MSIHNFSETSFTETVKDILAQNRFIHVRHPENITKDTSFREALDFTSLDVAELIIALEEKYRLNLDFAQTGNIDNISDIYKVFIQGMNNKRKMFVQNLVAKRQK